MEVLTKYFDLNPQKLNLLIEFQKIFTHWNSKINLVSRKDIEFFELKHILHSLSIAKYIDFKNSSVIDIGTGGGLPGIVLAIMFDDAKFLLIDSIGKKISAVQNMISELGLKNVSAQNIRSNDLHKKFDYVVARAVTNFPDFYKSVSHLLKNGQAGNLQNGIIYLKGGDLNDELSAYKSKIHITNISEYFDEEFFETKRIVYYEF